jgi:EAL and modified HD-GYP domain-containing signal transduction protein
LLALVARDADAHELEAAIKQDPALSYQLLKLVNSVAFGLSRSIDSLSQALMALGRRQLQRWLQLLLYAHPESGGNRAAPLMPWAALRGALMENLCASLGGDGDERDSAYMIGTFSLLDVLLGMSMTDLLKPLNLSAPVAEALLTHAGGRLGLLLGAAEAAERGDLATLATNLETLGLSTTAFASALCESYRWAIQVGKES